ncbi:hypothetical protein K1W69_05375 [Hoeflea sp. WL0058]|uniref:Uncharacterized protein n=1 Tax=Flavimaribacter sediminis TaxID=2865987 RepID=A0AAE2ZIJ9_9HYPH|nr:hypothetical protein [Flavimaribacter sediminis]MBW8636614.1 hypothetical protein [Flavimaribacter sediminis]
MPEKDLADFAQENSLASIRKIPLPENASLATCAQRAGSYADCYTVDVKGKIELSAYTESFFNTWLMRLERKLIGLGSKPSNDDDVRLLANGGCDSLAWWRVEKRDPDQLLLSVPDIATLTWLMVSKLPGATPGTRLYFGSAVLMQSRLSKALLPFHKAYSRLLLRSASRTCERKSR